jgi:hypothetical protein
MVQPWEPRPPTPPPVLVLGMHNSGTTMLAQILHGSGLFLGANAHHCESNFFSLFVNDRLIMGGGEAWARLPILPVEEVLRHRETAGQVVRDYWWIDYVQWGYDGTGPWGIKDPRLCVLLPLYLEWFPGAKLLLIRRDPDDIAASLAHRYKPGVGVKSDREFWKQLSLAHLQRVDEYARDWPAFHDIRYEELCRNPLEVARGMFEFLGLPYTEETRRLVRATVKTDRIGTQHWTEARWRWEKTKQRGKYLFGPLYNTLRGRG